MVAVTTNKVGKRITSPQGLLRGQMDGAACTAKHLNFPLIYYLDERIFKTVFNDA